MVGKRIAIIAGCLAMWMSASTGVYAFEQQAPVLSQTGPTALPSLLPEQKRGSPDEVPAPLTSKDAGKGMMIPGLGRLKMPNLNFGLDLMYSEDRKEDQNLGFTNDPLVENNVTIMGKVKRRF